MTRSSRREHARGPGGRRQGDARGPPDRATASTSTASSSQNPWSSPTATACASGRKSSSCASSVRSTRQAPRTPCVAPRASCVIAPRAACLTRRKATAARLVAPRRARRKDTLAGSLLRPRLVARVRFRGRRSRPRKATLGGRRAALLRARLHVEQRIADGAKIDGRPLQGIADGRGARHRDRGAHLGALVASPSASPGDFA